MKPRAAESGVAFKRFDAGAVVQRQKTTCWKASLDAYAADQLRELQFECDDEAAKAIGLLWSEDLHDCPYTFTPDGGIILPAGAVQFLRKASLQFSDYPVQS
jgi:hypothetical protein